MLLFQTNSGERINLENVSRIIARPQVLEMHFIDGTTRMIVGQEVVDRLEAILAAKAA